MDRLDVIAIDHMQPTVDFVCFWRVTGPVWYTYRVPSHQFLLVTAGRLRARSAGRPLEAVAGDLLCLRRETLTEYGYEAGVSYFEAHLSFAPPPRQALPLIIDGEMIPEKVSLGERADAARQVFETMCLVIDRDDDRHRLRMRQAVDDLLLVMLEANPPPRAARPIDPWQRMRALLESDFGKPLTLARLSAELGIGEDHIIRRFKTRFGISPMAYRAQAKLRWAAAALGQPESTVKEIAHKLGFTDASAFARAFRRQFGVSPSELRLPGAAQARLPPSDDASVPFRINHHLRPPGSATPFFQWG